MKQTMQNKKRKKTGTYRIIETVIETVLCLNYRVCIKSQKETNIETTT